MQITIEIKDEKRAKKFLDFLKEIPFLEIENYPIHKKSKKLPNEFYNPVKSKEYLTFNRDEIYDECIR